MDNRLYRDKKKAIAGGVAAGIANSLHLDITLIRALFVCLIVFGKIGVMASFVVYCVLWVAIPAQPVQTANSLFEADYRVDPQNPGTGGSGSTDFTKSSPSFSSQTDNSRIFGFILLGLGIVFLADRFIDIDWDYLDRFWPVLLILAGIAVLVGRRKSNFEASDLHGTDEKRS